MCTQGCVCEDCSGICVPSEWKCGDVREAGGEERQYVSPVAALRFCSSVETFVVSEKNFPNAFSAHS